MPEVYRVLRCVNFKNRKRISGKIVLALCNILPIFTAAVFTIWYSGTVCSSQEQMMQNNFCNTVSIYQSCAALQSFVAFCAASARQTHSDLRKPPCTKPFTAVQVFFVISCAAGCGAFFREAQYRAASRYARPCRRPGSSERPRKRRSPSWR